MNKIDLLKLDVKNFFKEEYSGHDYQHTQRVTKLAMYIAGKEKADTKIVELAALLHDVDDYKITGKHDSHFNAIKLMNKYDVDENIQEKVLRIIEEVSYMANDSVKPETLEGQIVQDADRLDAIGAIGIARAFMYSGNHGNLMYDPDIKPNLCMNKDEYINSNSTTINHFYEKLLLLKDMMNTSTAKKLAVKRHAFMEKFLEEFLMEWSCLK